MRITMKLKRGNVTITSLEQFLDFVDETRTPLSSIYRDKRVENAMVFTDFTHNTRANELGNSLKEEKTNVMKLLELPQHKLPQAV